MKCRNGDAAAAAVAAAAAAADLTSAAEELSELGLLRELTYLVSATSGQWWLLKGALTFHQGENLPKEKFVK